MKKELEENEKGEEREGEEEMNSNGAINEEDDIKACDDEDQEIVQNDEETGQNDQETVQDACDKVENGEQSESEAPPVALKVSEGVKEMSSAFEKQANKKEDAVKKGPADGNEGS